MIMLITGGSGSGKSEYAENLLLEKRTAWELQHPGEERKSTYIATMYPFDMESKKRIQRHQKMREKKHFETIECYTDLKKIPLQEEQFLLLECMSNLTANEMYREDGCRRKGLACEAFIVSEVAYCMKHAIDMVIVTNEISSDGIAYDTDTMEYMKILGGVNQKLAVLADQVIEVVYGIPIDRKK